MTESICHSERSEESIANAILLDKIRDSSVALKLPKVLPQNDGGGNHG